MKSVEITFSRLIDSHGFIVFLNGKGFRFPFPKEVWKAFPFKETFVDEMLFLCVAPALLLARTKRARFNSRKPIFFDEYLHWILQHLPSLTDAVWTDSLWLIERQFRNIQFDFSMERSECFNFETEENNAVLCFSSGAESLATLAVGEQIGLSMSGVYHSDMRYPGLQNSVSPFLEEISKKFSFQTVIIENEVNHLLSRQLWKQKKTAIGSAIEAPKYLLMLLPFAFYYRAKTLIFGNEYDYNYTYRKHKGEPLAKDPLRTAKGVSELNHWMNALTLGSVQVTSLLASTHVLGIQEIIHRSRPELGSFQISCRWSGLTENGRWCLQCETCAESYLHAVAFGRRPVDELGFSESMLKKSKRKYFSFPRKYDSENLWEFHSHRQEVACLINAKNLTQFEDGAIIHELKKSAENINSSPAELMKFYTKPMKLGVELPLLMRAEEAIERILKR